MVQCITMYIVKLSSVGSLRWYIIRTKVSENPTTAFSGGNQLYQYFHAMFLCKMECIISFIQSEPSHLQYIFILLLEDNNDSVAHNQSSSVI